MLTETKVRRIEPRARARKLSDGGGLYLLVVPTGGRYWRHNYRFNGKQKTLALGTSIRTFRSRRRGRVTRQPGAYTPKTWTHP
jgi:hypothetical protein